MKTLIFTLALLAAPNVWGQVAPKYFGATNVEAKLEFKGKVELRFHGNLTLASLSRETTRNETAFAAVREQIAYLIGHFSSQSFKDEVGVPGVLGEQMDFTFTEVESRGNSKTLHYKANGKVVFHKDIFGNNRQVHIPLRLPLNPERTYDLGLVDNENRCTDHHYNSFGDFFYFWDIEQVGCPLAGNDSEIVRIQGKLTKYENTRKTYPEYDRLYTKDVLDIRILMGYIGDEVSLTSPNYRDDGYISFKDTISELEALNFVAVEKRTKFRLTSDGRQISGSNYLTVLEKEVRNQLGHSQKVRITVYLGDTDINSRDATFHQILIPAFQEADILVYDGHSGLGANLGFDYLPEFEFDPSGKYQLFFINGCSSYPYFNGQFFRAKQGGSKNIDIITSGLSTYTSTSVANTMAFVAPFIAGGLWSYQTLLRHMERSNGDAGTYLTGVNGDEDNLFRRD